jgi:patatin-like phospholipase/acyl hydrolase
MPASEISVSDAALASSAAPTYFQPHTVGQQHYVDGGLIANSPDSLAINEATAVLGWPVGTVHLLSVGTTYVEVGVAFKPKLAHWGIARWGYRLTLLEQMMSAQAKLSRDMAQRTLSGRFYQIDAMRSEDQNQSIALDRASPIATSTLLAMAQNSWHTTRGSAAGRTMLQSLSLHQKYLNRTRTGS